MAKVRNLSVDVKDKNIRIALSHNGEENGEVLLSGYLGLSMTKVEEFHLERKNKTVIISWPAFGTLSLEGIDVYGGTRYDVQWELGLPTQKKQTLNDAFEMADSHWYGAAQMRQQTWPIEKWSVPLAPYICGDSFTKDRADYGGVQERYWLSSKGVALFVDEDVPLFVSMNHKGDKQINFVSKFEKPYKNVSNKNLYLKYYIYHGKDVKNVHEMVMADKINKPLAIPDEAIFRYPIWSTWAKFKKNINHEIVLQYAKEINDHGFKACQVEIDDDWTVAYGDMTFDRKKFPDPKATVDELKALGHRVTLWVHPFASPFSKACYAGPSNWYVKSGKLPGMCKWWNGLGRHVDFTNPEASTWYKENLKKLKDDFGVTSFKFDAGEINWMPPFFTCFKDFQNPNVFTKRYIEMACEVDAEVRCHEVRVGWRTQHLPVLVRMMDKDSTWTHDKGLKSLIPHALTFSIIGYHFMLPDMIGGNGYEGFSFMLPGASVKGNKCPNKELFIRWLQANVFLPSLQFSFVPWQYDEETISISRKMCELHEKYSDYIIELAKDCIKTGNPIIRPLWWINPGDDVTLSIDSQFLLGNKLLVAPVLDEGAHSRDIYFPIGSWKDENNSEKIIDGPTWIKDYPANLETLPYFSQVVKSEPSEKKNIEES